MVLLLSCSVGCAPIPASRAPGKGLRVAIVDARWCIGGNTLVVEDWEVAYGAERIGPTRRTRFEGGRVVAATHRQIAKGRLLAARIRLSGLPKEHHYAAAFGYAALGDAEFGDAATRVQACNDYAWAMAQVYRFSNRPVDTGLASYLMFMLAWCAVTLPPAEDHAQFRHDILSGHILVFAARLGMAARMLEFSKVHAGLGEMFKTSLGQVIEQIPDPKVRRCVREHPERATDPACAEVYTMHDTSAMCGD